jgi:hypothetical protein
MKVILIKKKEGNQLYRAVLPGRGKPSRPAFPKTKASLGPFKAGTVFNQSINQNKEQSIKCLIDSYLNNFSLQNLSVKALLENIGPFPDHHRILLRKFCTENPK